MTTNDAFGRDLSAWLRDDAADRVPDHLDQVLVRTAATRQRPWWASPERWLPMIVTARTAAWAPSPRLGRVLLAAAVILAIVALAILAVGSRPRLPAPFGAAANGLIAYGDGNVVMVANADGSSARQLLALRTPTPGLDWSPDGTRLAIIEPGDGQGLFITDATGSRPVTITLPTSIDGATEIAWAPDSNRILVSTIDPAATALFIVDVRDSSVERVPDDRAAPLASRIRASWAPDGSLISFFGRATGDKDLSLYVAHPDGSALRRLPTIEANPDWFGGSWAPVLDRRLLLFVSGTNDPIPSAVEVVDADSGEVTLIGNGFWPTWSSDARRITWWDGHGLVAVDTAAALAAPTTSTPVQLTQGLCDPKGSLAARALCSPGLSSPDAKWLVGVDYTGQAITLVSLQGTMNVDGSLPGATVRLAQPVEPGSWPVVSWQRVAP